MITKTEKSPFLGDIYYRDAEGRQLSAKASVFCTDRAYFDAEIEAYLNPSNAIFLWSEEVHEVNSWLSKFGHNTLMMGLAKRVSDTQKVALSDPQFDGEEAEDDGYLIIEEIEGVEPLDFQFGIWPKRSVPEPLQEAIFGQPEPTEEEIEQYGENVPEMGTYAILDAGKMPQFLVLLENSELEYQCLFQGDAEEELKNVAPYIVKLEDGNDFTRGLFTKSGMPGDMWEKELGIFIRSRATLAELRKHFRKFTKVQDEQGKWYYFRFWEGKALRHLIQGATVEKQKNFFFIKFEVFIISEDQKIFKIYPQKDILDKQEATFALSKDDLKNLRKYRHLLFKEKTKKWLQETYGSPENVKNVDRFLYDEIQFAIDNFRSYDQKILSYYAAASWIMGTRAWDTDLLVGREKEFTYTAAKRIYHEAFARRYRNGKTL